MDRKTFESILGDLTRQQRKILKRFLAGESDQRIANTLDIEESTVRKHLANICTSFGLVNEEGEHFSHREELVELFVTYRPDLVNFDVWDGYRYLQVEPDFPGRPVSSETPFYIERLDDHYSSIIERLCVETVSKPGALIRIRATKKMGKTSLMNHILKEAQDRDHQTINLNLLQAEPEKLDNLDHFLRWFCSNISYKLHLDLPLDDYWDNEYLGSKSSCTTYFQAYLLEQIDAPLVLGLDNVDRLFEYPKTAEEFFPLLRSWHEEANNQEIWQKLRLLVAHATEVYINLDLDQSPFGNVGLPIRLPELTLEQVQQLAKHYGLNWTGRSEAEQLMEMVGGHPYLIQLALYWLRQKHKTLTQLLQAAPTQNGIYRNHLLRLWAQLQEYPELAAALKTVIEAEGSVPLGLTVAYKLEAMGLVKFEGNQVRCSCKLYRDFFFSS